VVSTSDGVSARPILAVVIALAWAAHGSQRRHRSGNDIVDLVALLLLADAPAARGLDRNGAAHRQPDIGVGIELQGVALQQLVHDAYCRFDPGAVRQLAELLRAVAVYAAGGMTALAARRDAGAVKLLSLVLAGLRPCHQVRSACSRGLSMD